MDKVISIVSFASISPLGSDKHHIWQQYLNNKHCLSRTKADQLISCLSNEDKANISKLRATNKKYKNLDDSVLFAIFVGRKAYAESGWNNDNIFGINIGSSRGATALFEKYHRSFLNKSSNKVSPLSSPTTTLGNISSWLAHDLQSMGPDISHSITCSTALHSLLNGIAWLRSGMANKFLVGGSEAPLTDFTLAQMQALGIYAKGTYVNGTSDYPCRALDLDKQDNGMVLGEAAAVACLEVGRSNNALAYIEGIGYATELLEHNTSISTNADCLQLSMEMALKDHSKEDIDLVVTHTPGTIKGDKAEISAIEAVFAGKLPALTTNKWKLGHSLATSGMLSMELALLMMEKQQFIAVPYLNNQKTPLKIQNILVNAVGFGGNAVSILISKPTTYITYNFTNYEENYESHKTRLVKARNY